MYVHDPTFMATRRVADFFCYVYFVYSFCRELLNFNVLEQLKSRVLGEFFDQIRIFVIIYS